jgi:hypothetical protein
MQGVNDNNNRDPPITLFPFSLVNRQLPNYVTTQLLN